jgi:hypothetical protein
LPSCFPSSSSLFHGSLFADLAIRVPDVLNINFVHTSPEQVRSPLVNKTEIIQERGICSNRGHGLCCMNVYRMVLYCDDIRKNSVVAWYIWVQKSGDVYKVFNSYFFCYRYNFRTISDVQIRLCISNP